MMFFFFQAEDGIRDLVRSRGLGLAAAVGICHQIEQSGVVWRQQIGPDSIDPFGVAMSRGIRAGEQQVRNPTHCREDADNPVILFALRRQNIDCVGDCYCATYRLSLIHI